MSLAPRLALGSALIVVLATLEQIFFGRDTPGTAHDVSVAAWLLSLAAAAVLVVSLLRWLVGRSRRRT